MTALERFGYSDGDQALSGWLARPAARPRAAVIVYPTIANVTAAVERRAVMLADAGYLALIADFYGEPEPSFEAARGLAQALRRDVDTYRKRIAAGFDALKGLPEAQGLPIAAVGYCMGGQAALELARSGAQFAAAVSFHGLLDTGRPAAAPVRPRILVCHGERDPLVPREQVLAFWDEMNAAGARWHFHTYSGARHGFTDPGSDSRGLDAVAYDAAADRQSWAAMLALFDEVFC